MHNQRFFSYLSLFTFMMIVLVTGNNYLLMFVGWEGYKCLIGLYLYLNLINYMSNKKRIKDRTFYTYNFNSSYDIISLIIGSLLGNSYIKRNKLDKSIIITFIKCSDNIEYLMLFYKYLVSNGYCDLQKPKLKRIISKNNKVLLMYVIDSYNIYNLDWIYGMFYRNNKKIIPENLKDYLTPLSFATWYLDSSYKLPKSDLSSFNIKNKDIKYISEIFKDKYNINTTIQLEGKDKVTFYIKNSSNNEFNNVVKPYILPSLQYKLKSQHNKLTLWNQSNFNSNILNSLNCRNYSTEVKDTKYTTKYKKEYELSIIQKEALIGIILGDGFLERNKPTHNTRLRIEQSSFFF